MADRIGNDLTLWLHPGVCPDCGGRVFQFGPRGGAAQNVRCVACGQWWNVLIWTPPTLIQRIDPGGDDGA